MQEEFRLMPLRLLQIDKGNFIPSVGSTNDWIRNPDIECGSWVVAENQTAGRGRKGNSWQILGQENLIFSGKISLGLTDLPLTLVSLFAGASLLRAIYEWFPERESDTTIKWPNDIYRKNQKIAGILIETEVIGDEFKVIIGFGLNLYGNELPIELENRAGFLTDSPPTEGTKERILYSFLERLNEALIQLMDAGSTARYLGWIEAHSLLVGKRIAITLGSEHVSGEILGYDSNGFMVVLEPTGMKRILMDSDPSLEWFDK